MTRKLIIDCDPGHDDIMALFTTMAHPKELEIMAITTVCGNHYLDKVTLNLCKVLSYIGASYPIAKGYDSPLRRKSEPQPGAHGESGMDGPILPEPTVHPLKDVHAIELMKKVVEESNEPVTIVGLGPLTNVGMFLKTFPHLKSKIDCVTIMGGGISRGNMLPMSEFNIYADPEAAKIVFNSGVKVIMSGIEVCDDCAMMLTEMDALKGKGKIHDLAYDLFEFYSQYSRKRNWDRSPVFDVVPIVHLLHPEYFKERWAVVDVETEGDLCRGMTVVDSRPSIPTQPNTVLLTDGNRDGFVACLLESIEILERTL